MDKNIRKRKQVVAIIYFSCLILLFGLTAGFMLWVEGPEAIKAAYVDFCRSARDRWLLFKIIFFFTLPFALFYLIFLFGEKNFLRVFESMPFSEQNQLNRGFAYQMNRSVNNRVSGFIFTENYVCFSDKYILYMENLLRLEDIVWIYMRDTPWQFEDMKKGISMPLTHFYSTVIRTADGKSHSAFTADSKGLIQRCPHAVLGYGREQKRAYKEELQRRAMLWEETARAQKQTRRNQILLAAGLLAAAVFLGPYLYKFMKIIW